MIEYRRCSMIVQPEDAETWAACFSALADPTRIRILNLLATAEEPLTVGQIVSAVDVGQSTVSYHLGILASVAFATVEHVGTSSLWRVNEACVACLPAAAEIVMGRGVRDTPWERSTAADRAASRPKRRRS